MEMGDVRGEGGLERERVEIDEFEFEFVMFGLGDAFRVHSPLCTRVYPPGFGRPIAAYYRLLAWPIQTLAFALSDSSNASS